MALSFGPGVSRTLDPVARAFQNVVFQKGKPPLDSEFNLQDSIHDEQLRQQIASMMPSGFVFDPTRAYEYYGFDKLNSNQFRFGQVNPLQNDQPSIIAVVNGLVVQVAGTDIAASVDNVVKLYPAPTSNNRVDLVFLEVWQALVAPNPATQNKPSASTIWKYGNTKFGGVNLPDDLQDPTLGFETTKRVQTQYRIRVVGAGVTGVDLGVYPDGMGDPAVLAQGTAATPQAGFGYANMGQLLGDPSLWRSGNGNPANALGTVDGYSYAIPICAVFRRNSSVFVAVNSAGAANQNGSLNRRPTTNTLANPLSGAALLSVPRLNATLLPGAALPATVNVVGLVGSGVDDPLHYAAGNSLYVTIDDEIVEISAVNTTLSTITIASRGRNKTQITRHNAGAEVLFYSVRSDGLFADEVAPSDVLDLRRAVNPGAWDYNQLLAHNLAALFRNRLQTTWKQSLVGTSQGPVVTEVDYMYADNPAVPVNTIQVDGPDGIRTVFSDAATIQRDVTMLLDNSPALTNGFTNSQFDTNMVWDVGANFVPNGFVNNLGATGFWTNGTVIFVHVEGATANDGARGTFKWAPSVEAVKFLTPRDYWKVGYPQGNLTDGDQNPVKMRFVGPVTGQPPAVCLAHQPIADGETSVDSTAEVKHPGPMYPWEPLRFLSPYVVLGDILNTNLVLSGLPVATTLDSTRNSTENVVEIDVGINFDLVGNYYTIENDDYALTPATGLANPLINGQKTLFDLLTAGGTQRVGVNSDVIVVMYGDDGSRDNNGAFLVVGAGTTAGKRASTGIPTLQNFTSYDASSSTRLVCIPLNMDFSGAFNTTTGNTVDIQIRSQISTVEGGTGSAGQSAMCIVLNDIGGKQNSPWNRDTLGRNQVYPDLNFSVDYSLGYARVAAKAVLSMALQYSPARGAQSHVPDILTRFALRGPTADYLRQANSAIDPTFPTETGYPAGESMYPPVNVQLWNRLPAYGWDAGAKDPVTGSTAGISYGGGIVANTEQDRESELFIDLGSKTAIYRPFRQRNMTLQAVTVPLVKAGPPAVSSSLIGSLAYPTATLKDGLSLFTQGGTMAPLDVGTLTGGKCMGFSIPPEYMPRFGRQDIPYYVDTATPAGSGTFLEGINHLFLDTTDPTQGQTVMMGGRLNPGPGNAVYSLFFRAAPIAFPASTYGDSGTFIDGAALNRPFYDARRAPFDISNATPEGQTVIQKFNQVTSSDLGAGLKGIQLPPYLGIARLYGVYEYTNYVAGGGVTWSPDRATYIGLSQPTPIQNLLRKDADPQSLFIMQDGALDLTTETGDHTYIVPSNVIDLTKIPTYTPGLNDQFEDFEYVVECVVFGFAKDWINGNDYVLCRQRDGEATQYLDGDNPQIETTQMVLPCAAHINAQAYSVIDRTVYQGDPFGTRNGVTQTVTDYLNRYGTVPLGSAAQLATPIQQFDTNGNFLPLTYNPRSFEVLSSIDFYTTMGTGKIGGKLYAGTPLDVGYIQDTPNVATRIPASGTDFVFRNTWDRAFTEGQKDEPNRAGVIINTLVIPASTAERRSPPEILNGMFVNLTNIAGQTVSKRGVISPTDFRIWASSVTVNSPVAGQTTVRTTREHGLAVNDRVIFTGILDDTNSSVNLAGTTSVLQVLNLREFVILTPGPFGASITVNASYFGQVTLGEEANDSVFGVASRSGSQLLTATVLPDLPTLVPAGTIAGGSSFDLTVAVAGARVGDAVTVNGDDFFSFFNSNLVVTAWVDTDDTVIVRFSNPSAAAIPFAQTVEFYVTVTPRILDTHTTLFNLASHVINDATVSSSIRASLPPNGESLLLQSTVAGVEGNRNYVSVGVKPLGVGITAVTNANPMEVTTACPLTELYPNFNPTVGATSSVYLTGFTGAGAAAVNNRFWVATTTGDSTFTITFNNVAGTVTTAAPSGSSSGTMAFPQLPPIGNIPGVYAANISRSRVWLSDPSNNRWISPDSVVSASNFVGGVDVPVNAGIGNSQLALTGMTERLPLGILLNDSDFLSENPLNDAASAVQTFPSALRPIQKLLPLTTGGQEYDRFLGAPGDLVAQADGSILQYTPYNASTAPAGTRGYRMYRGGGSLFVLDGPNPGGPVDFAVTSFPPAIRPILKGGVLVGKAMLVRNFPEEAFAPSRTTSYGDEIQMLVITNGVFGTTLTTRDGLTLDASIGSAGYGEGYAASDRYRIDGKPMFRDFSFRHPDPANVQPTPYIKEV